jgi:hypothetical protein
MKNNSINIALFSVFLFSISCSTMQYNINRNNKFTEKQINFLLQKNGNVFYLSSTYATGSIIWTYNTGEIEMYKLAKGKVIRKETFSEEETLPLGELALKDIENELYQKCALELDGDSFGFNIDINGITYKASYAVDINCLKAETYKSDFLNKIANDIKTCNMWEWEVKYQ